jgi:uncharacterized membrane protein YqaE (UPF0057 family)
MVNPYRLPDFPAILFNFTQSIKTNTMRKGLFLLIALITLGSSVGSVSYSMTVTSLPDSSIVPSGEPDAATIKAAIKEFKSLSKKDKKERLREVKKAWKAFKKQKRDGGDAEVTTVLLVILALILPPLAVYLHQGSATTKFWISLLLTLLVIITLFLWIIPVVYALLVVLNLI